MVTETANEIIIECSKLAQQGFKSRHEWVGKAIHWELYKRFEFGHADKYFIQKPQSVLENETWNSLWV